MLVSRYLRLAGAIEPQKVETYNSLYQFKLEGDRVPCGRLLVNKEGLQVWHSASANGLKMPKEWKDSGQIKNGCKVYFSQRSTLDKAVTERIEKISRYVDNDLAPKQQFPHLAESEILSLAGFELQKLGWSKLPGGTSNLENWQSADGDNACRLVARGDYATVFSHRNIDLMPSPWRQGRDMKDGNQSFYVTTRDLTQALSPVQLSNLKTAPTQTQTTDYKKERPQINAAMIDTLIDEHIFAAEAPKDHYQLHKKGANLKTENVLIFTAGKNTGSIMAPVFRFGSDVAKLNDLELCGVQTLFRSAPKDYTDKPFEAGSIQVGAFTTPRFSCLMPSSPDERTDLNAWLRTCDKTKPLIICEGYASGLALEQTGCGNAICAMNAANMPLIAKQLKVAGLDKEFSGVVIAADLDTKLDKTGIKFSSKGIPAAIEAAQILDAKVALAPAEFDHGTDSRDLLGAGGLDAIFAYIANAMPPDDVMQRPDLKAISETMQKNLSMKKDVGIER